MILIVKTKNHFLQDAKEFMKIQKTLDFKRKSVYNKNGEENENCWPGLWR